MARPDLKIEIGVAASSVGPDYLVIDSPTVGIIGQNRIAPSTSPPAFDNAWLYWGSGTWDNFRWNEPATIDNATWVDITNDVTQAQISRGRQRQLETTKTGTLSVTLDDPHRWYDPSNLDATSPFVRAGVSLLKYRTPVRVTATWNGVTYPRFWGWIDSYDPRYAEPGSASCTITAVDGFGVLANIDGHELGLVGGGELSGARIHRLLDAAGWPTTARAIDPGVSTLQSTNMAQNRLTEMKLTADSERGELYMSTTGHVVFRDRNWRKINGRSNTSGVTWGDAPGEHEYDDAQYVVGGDLLKNSAYVTRVGGTQQTWSDGASIAAYYERSYTRTDLIFQTDAEALQVAQEVVGQYSQQDASFQSLTVTPDANDDAALWPIVLGAEFGDRWTVRRRPLGGALIEQEVFVEGVTETIAPRVSGDWSLRFDLATTTGRNWMIWGHPVLGLYDTSNRWS